MDPEPRSDTLNPPAERLIRAYVLAKDTNRPHLLAGVFAPAARLEMSVATDAISFPGVTEGLAGITDVLVSTFGRTYENIYTFCQQSPGPDDRDEFSCDWLVGMSAKADGAVRVGCGHYRWRFGPASTPRVTALEIAIEAMSVLAPGALHPVMDWLTGLPYPWCPAGTMLHTMPAVGGLEPVRERLLRIGPR